MQVSQINGRGPVFRHDPDVQPSSLPVHRWPHLRPQFPQQRILPAAGQRAPDLGGNSSRAGLPAQIRAGPHGAYTGDADGKQMFIPMFTCEIANIRTRTPTHTPEGEKYILFSKPEFGMPIFSRQEIGFDRWTHLTRLRLTITTRLRQINYQAGKNESCTVLINESF